MIDIEEKYDLMKLDLEKAVKEADKLNEICYRLERENSDYHFENMKLEKQLAIAIEALKYIYDDTKKGHTQCDACGYCSSCENCINVEWAKKALKDLEELEK